jgi:hypothetical protein
MNTLKLVATHKTSSGAAHIKILLNDNDVGLLFLTEKEIQVLMNILRLGLVNSDTRLQTDLIQEEEEEQWWSEDNDNI